jgi:hypothetical protein
MAMTEETIKALIALLERNIDEYGVTDERLDALYALDQMVIKLTLQEKKTKGSLQRWREGVNIWRCECGEVIAYYDTDKNGERRFNVRLHGLTFGEDPALFDSYRGRCYKCNIRHDIPLEKMPPKGRVTNLRSYYDWLADKKHREERKNQENP